MGLDFSHTDARWAYSGFGRFRTRLAEAEGIDLPNMEGFRHSWEEPRELRPWSSVTTPLKPLLDHSDCDGELTPEECAQVSPRLREILATWPEDDHDRRQGLLLADGMDLRVKNNENLEFC